MVALTLAAVITGILVGRSLHQGINVTAIGLITFLAFPVMGLLILRQQPKNAVGWLLLGIGLNIYVVFFGEDYAYLALIRHPGSLPFGHAFAWISGITWLPFTLMVVLFLPMLFPTGRLLSPRWRLVIASGLGFALLAFVGNAFQAGSVSSNYPQLKNPLGVPGWKPLLDLLTTASLPFGLIAMIGSVGSVVVRYRRANSLERRQLKWFLVALVTAIVPFVLQGSVPMEITQALVSLAIPLLPISIAIAVLRYRLYDIDIVINRALVYGALAAFITVVYVAIVVGIGRVIGSGTRPNLTLSIVATAVVAVAFQPVRERLQRFANRLIYGKRASPYEVMAGFADRMAGTLSIDQVLPQMAEAAARGVGASAARATLFLPNGESRSTVWPAIDPDGAFARVLPIAYRGEPMGEIAIRENPGQGIRPAEGRLLADLAQQAGLVFHNVRLTAELEARLSDLSAQAAELRASRMRIVTAQETERRRLGGEIRTGVQQELEATRAQLDEVERLIHEDAGAASARLVSLTGETQRTLDALRELARGIFPPLLADKGIVPALEAQTRKTAVPASIHADPGLAGVRFDPGVEAAVYFCCVEALRRVDSTATVEIGVVDGALTFAIQGVGALNGRLEGLRDRLEALGGSIKQDQSGQLRGTVPAEPLVAVP
jgi:signal transduction histidine kinase